MPGWRNTPFEMICTGDGEVIPLYSGRNNSRLFKYKNMASLVTGGAEVGIVAPDIVIWNNAAKSYYTYIGCPIIKNWNGRQISLAASIIIRPFVRIAED
jgi:hypothetical protein